MKVEELDEYLSKLTLSEIQHLERHGELSKRYNQIPVVTYEGKKLYRFSFYRALGDKDIWLMKESRFTPIPPHIHDVIELNYVYRGQCNQTIDGDRLSLLEGDFCLLDCNTPHEVLPLSERDIVITIDMRRSYLMNTLLQHLASNTIVSSFLAQSIMDNVQSKRHLIFHAQDETVRTIMQLFMCDYFSQGSAFDEPSNAGAASDILNAYMVIVFSHLMRLYQERGGEDIEHPDNPFVDILQFIDRNPNVKLGELAKHFGYNETYLGGLIKRKTGSTFKQLTFNKKMASARLWLETTDIPVYEIAETIGYHNLGFFYRKFSETFGCTPQEYRDASRGRKEDDSHEAKPGRQGRQFHRVDTPRPPS